jgi:hypothetical protein
METWDAETNHLYSRAIPVSKPMGGCLDMANGFISHLPLQLHSRQAIILAAIVQQAWVTFLGAWEQRANAWMNGSLATIQTP